MRMADRKAGDPVPVRRLKGHGQAARESRLREAEPRIDRDRTGARGGGDRLDRTRDPAGDKLATVAFKVVKPADDIPGLFGAGHVPGLPPSRAIAIPAPRCRATPARKGSRITGRPTGSSVSPAPSSRPSGRARKSHSAAPGGDGAKASTSLHDRRTAAAAGTGQPARVGSLAARVMRTPPRPADRGRPETG